jgi:DNA invertase Pin-like site-specific DNA recombinase
MADDGFIWDVRSCALSRLDKTHGMTRRQDMASGGPNSRFRLRRLAGCVTLPEGSETGSDVMATKAIAYYRTSSATNVGADRDSEARQKLAVETFAKRAGYEIVDSFYDAAVSGADPIDTRAGFTAALARIAGNGVRTIVVETASRFARDLMVQETGHAYLRSLGVELIAADSPEAFLSDSPTAVMVRQVLGAVSQFEKAALVAKLKGARDRKRRETGKCGGRKSYVELSPETVAIAKRLSRYHAKGHERSLRDIAAELARQGHMSRSGKPYGAEAISRMIGK